MTQTLPNTVYDSSAEDQLSYTGWRMVLASFIGVGVSFAPMVPYTFSLFLAPLEGAFGWKREAISNAFAIAALTVAAVSPLIGTLLDRLPPRRIILPSILVFAAGMASLSLLHGHIAQFYLSYFVLGIVGNGTAQLSYSRTILTWFRKRRGLALALVLSGSGTGSILLPMLAEHMIATHGWRSAYLALGATALLGFPLTAVFLRNRGEATHMVSHAQTGGSIANALKTRSFWIIAISVMLGAFSMNAVIAHLGAMLAGRGVSGTSAAMALSALGISAIVARLFSGMMLDRVPAPVVGCFVSLIAASGAAMLAYARTPAAGLCGAVLMGAGSGSEADVVPYMIAQYLGRARFSTLYGLSWTAYAIGGAIGPVMLGWQFDKAATYVPFTVLLFSIPCFISALMQLGLPIRQRAAWLQKEAALDQLTLTPEG